VRLADRDISLVFTNIHPSKSKPTATVMVVQDSTSQVLRQGVIGVGQTLSLEDLGVPVSFELDRYLGSAVLRVTEDPGLPLIFSGSLILLLGMILSLFFRYRKVWVAVLPDGDQSQVQVGGFTSKHKLAFTVEFNGLLGEIKAQ
ncbi:MAG TPA: cytochrome c biogenesis protein ResB, partial [Desulfobacteria bacterium]|nr:cytochrome c biogenesis protein ResB [Desulfobacteria bacterium]